LRKKREGGLGEEKREDLSEGDFFLSFPPLERTLFLILSLF